MTEPVDDSESRRRLIEAIREDLKGREPVPIEVNLAALDADRR